MVFTEGNHHNPERNGWEEGGKMAALTYSAEIFANNKNDRMNAAGSVSSRNPPLVSLCCHRLSEAAQSAVLTWLSFGTGSWIEELVSVLSVKQRATPVVLFYFIFLYHKESLIFCSSHSQNQ